MLIKYNIKYGYNDVAVIPSVLSSISHRSECDPFLENDFLPIFTAPMSGVLNENNFEQFESNRIIPILPRSVDLTTRIDFIKKGKWVAFSLKEFDDVFNYTDSTEYFKDAEKIHALIDIANGHMVSLYNMVKSVKTIHGDKIEIMIGNIANPKTYEKAYEAGADYVRVSIGHGSCCITSSNVAINYPIASLIDEIAIIKKKLEEQGQKNLPKIIADGGIRNYNDVIKALALGADYVMIGSLFAALPESTSTPFIKDGDKFVEVKNAYITKISEDGFMIYRDGEKPEFTTELYKKFYGMASKEGQIDLCGSKSKTAEGISKFFKVTTSLDKWSQNMIDYLKSAMSYTNSRTLEDFKNAEVIVISNNAFSSINR